MNIKKYSTRYLYQRRKTLIHKMIPLISGILRGSLIETYQSCGNKTCSCRKGRRHGPKYYLSINQSGPRRPQIEYVPQYCRASVDQAITNFSKVKELLEKICDINREILRRRQQL